MERKRTRSLSCGEEEEGGDRRISPRKRTRVRYTEKSYDVEEEEDDDDDGEEERGTDVEKDDEQPGPSTSDYGNTQKNKNDRFWTVTCGTKTGRLDKAKLKKGAKCIECDGRWFLPPAFENLAGKSYCRKWKATIFHENKPLQYWFEEGYLTATRFKRGSAQTPKRKTGPYISESSSEEEEETEDKDYRDENELSGGEEPEWEADERSSEAANDTGVEDSLQDTSGDKEDQLESESVSAASRTLRLSELKANLVRTCDRKKLGVVLERLSEKNYFPFSYICCPNGESLSKQLDENQEKKEDSTSTLHDPSFTDAAHVDCSQMSGPSLVGGLKEERVEEFTPSSERKEKVEDESGNDLSPLTTAEELTQSSDRKEAQTEKEVVEEEDKTGNNLSLVSAAEGFRPSSERKEVVKEEEDDDQTGNNSAPLTAAEELTQSSDRKEAQTKEVVVVVVIKEEDKTANNSSPLSTEEEFTPSSENKEAQIEEEVVAVVIEEEDDDKIRSSSSPLSTAEGFSQSSDRKEAQTGEEEDETGNNSSPVSPAEGFTPSSERKEAQKEDIVAVEEEDDDKTGNNSSVVSNAANLSSPPGLFVTATDTSLVGDVKGRGEERGEDGPETQSRGHKGLEECRNAYQGNIAMTTAEAASQTFRTGHKTSWAAPTRKVLKKERVEDDPDMDSYDGAEDTTSSHDAAQPQPLKQDERALQASQTPGTTRTYNTVPPASSRDLSGCDLDTMDLSQLRMEKMRMQIKVLKLQEEYYTAKMKALQNSS